MSPYIDPQTIHNPATGGVAPASWGDTVRDDLEFLISPPQCSFEHSTTQTVATSTWTPLRGNTENYDTDTMHASGSSGTPPTDSKATATTAGKYDVNAVVEWAANATGYRSARLMVNNTTAYPIFTGPNNGGTGTLRIAAGRTLILAAGDYVVVELWQNSGGNLACQLIELTARFVSR